MEKRIGKSLKIQEDETKGRETACRVFEGSDGIWFEILMPVH